MGKGLFVVFEGIEGSGKSTQIKLLKSYLESHDKAVLATQEPGGTQIGESIRDVLLNPDFETMNSNTELLLYVASRSQHVEELISPAIESGKIVLCDRYVLSSLAYQGFGRGLPQDEIREINKWATGGLEPDLTFILLLDLEEGLRRATKRYSDRIEQESLNFHKKVQKGYQELAEQDKKCVTVDASGEREDVHKEIVKIVRQELKIENEK